MTGWNRRSRAASFSMCFLYSSRVVAPMQLQLAAREQRLQQIARVHGASAGAGPTTVCSSSMNRTIWPCASWTALSTALSRSLELAAVLGAGDERAMSRATIALVLQPLGDVAAHDALGQPSTIAVLPTPGGPISTGLFLVRRERIWMDARISSSRPMTGSSFPCCASA